MTSTAFSESPERQHLRKAVREFTQESFGPEYFLAAAREDRRVTELWEGAAKLGYVGVNIAEEFGGGGGELGDLAAVLEEMAAAGAPLLMLVVSPAIVGTIIGDFGSDEQKQRWLPGIADGSAKYAFAITEADAGSNSHKIVTTAYREEDGWRLTGNKTFISGVDESSHILVVSRTEDAKTGKLKPALFMVPTDSPGLVAQQIDMGITLPEKQWTLFFDDVRLPKDALVGDEDAAISQLFAGLIPERIMAASMALGSARLAMEAAIKYAKERKVFNDTPIGAHQGIAFPLAEIHMEIEAARLMVQKAAALHAAGDHMGAGEAANIAKYLAGEVSVRAVDQAIQTHGGNGLAREFGLVDMLAASRLGRIAPVSREMILAFVAQFSLGLPKSY
ncbi:MAG TPA: acyl-CoA dehydrogenase [Aeromicrobium sp.]|nr:acyl-CoA dehydrogenase [Aeromicrobium sp.]